MKLTKLLLVLTAFGALTIASESRVLADPLPESPKTVDVNITATVSNHCSITKTDVSFGEYDPILGAQKDAQGNVSVACTTGAPGLSIALDGGKHFATPHNQMVHSVDGAQFLQYDLYSDTGRTGALWNNSSVTITAPPSGAARDFPIYGRILATQTNVKVGSYSDIVVASINF